MRRLKGEMNCPRRAEGREGMLLDKEFLEVVAESGKLRVRIAELQAENAKLRKALKPLAKWPVLTGADFFRLMPDEIREAQIALGEE
jgi:hypothetical protein